MNTETAELTDSVSGYTREAAPNNDHRNEDAVDPGAAGEQTQEQIDAAAELTAKDDAAAQAVADALAEGGKATAETVAEVRAGKIPLGRFNEVISQRDKAAQERDAMAQRLAALEQQERDRATEAARLAAEAAKAPPRDFKAERAALKEKYRNGTLDQDEYEDARDALADEESAEREARIEAAATKKAADMLDQRTAKQREDQQNEAFASARTSFLAEPANSIYGTSVLAADALNKAMQLIFAQDPELAPTDLFAKANAEVRQAFGMTPAPTPKKETEQERVKRERGAQAALLAAQGGLAALPPAGGMGARGAGQQMDDEADDISRAEWARLSQAERDRRLGKTT